MVDSSCKGERPCKKSGKSDFKVRRSAAAWSEILCAQRDLGLTVKAYCAGQGIGESTFWNWRKRVGPIPQTIAAKNPAPRFLPVAITSPATTTIEVFLGEMRVRLDGHAAVQIVEAIVLRIGARVAP